MSAIVGQAYQHLLKKQVSLNANFSGLSFLQCLSQTIDDDVKKTAYVHPIQKRSVTNLSLEMCTESLGTENGSDSGDEISLLAFKETNVSLSHHHRLTTKPEKETNFVMTRENNFPPPLNSFVEGSQYSLMVKSYKEDGRLVVTAIRVCSPPRCFVSERCEGRLRLCLSENSSLTHDGKFEGSEYELETHDEDDEEEDDVEVERRGQYGEQ